MKKDVYVVPKNTSNGPARVLSDEALNLDFYRFRAAVCRAVVFMCGWPTAMYVVRSGEWEGLVWLGLWQSDS